jgi:hypothetical protein
MKVIVTDSANQTGVIYVNDDPFWTPLPPESGPLRDVYDDFIAGGGEVEVAPEIPAPASDQETLSDWRVGLIRAGRFHDVQARVIAARDAGTEDGLIAWERFEYANHVFRAELLAFKDVFGFTAEEVDASMEWARQVREMSPA